MAHESDSWSGSGVRAVYPPDGSSTTPEQRLPGVMTQEEPVHDEHGARIKAHGGRVLAGSMMMLLWVTLCAVPAAATHPAEVLTSGLPAGWSWGNGPIENRVGVKGPATPPLGTGSLRTESGDTLFIPYSGDANDFAFSGWMYPPEDGGAIAVVSVDTTGDLVWDERLQLGMNNDLAWNSFDMTEAQVLNVQDSSWQYGDPTSWAEYLAEHLTAVVVGAELACPKSADIQQLCYIDAVTLGTEGDPTTYDFEPLPQWNLTTTVSRPRVLYDDTVTVTGTLTDDQGDPQSDTAVALYKKAWGDDGYTLVKPIVGVDGDGVATLEVTPRRRTAYQWRVVNRLDQNIVPAAPTAVDVRRVVTAKVEDRTIRTTQRLRVTGLTRSAAGGVTVLLRRVGSTRALAMSTVRADGTYSFSRSMPKGTWTVYTTVYENAGLLSGTSPKTEVTVR